jgi:hypothetical protein
MRDFQRLELAYVVGNRQVMPDDNWGHLTQEFDRSSEEDMTALGINASITIHAADAPETDFEFNTTLARFAEAAEPPITSEINPGYFTFFAAAREHRSRREATQRQEEHVSETEATA